MRRSAFSLLELLAVVTIVGIIAAIAVARFAAPVDSAKQGADDAHMRRVQSAIERYAVEQGAYPTTMTDLVTAGYLEDAVITSLVDPAKTVTFTAGDAYMTVRME